MSDDELKETNHIKGIIKYFLLGLKGLLYIFHLVLRYCCIFFTWFSGIVVYFSLGFKGLLFIFHLVLRDCCLFFTWF